MKTFLNIIGQIHKVYVGGGVSFSEGEFKSGKMARITTRRESLFGEKIANNTREKNGVWNTKIKIKEKKKTEKITFDRRMSVQQTDK